jgi:cytochrome c peroxidase
VNAQGLLNTLRGVSLSAVLAMQAAWAQPGVFPPDKPGPPGSLKLVPPPLPANLGNFVVNTRMAIILGKALFWDQQAGSDGQACGSCHFHAGADNRVKNQLSPGLRNQLGGAISQTFNLTASNRTSKMGPPPGGGPNYTLKKADFPYHQLSDPTDRNSAVVFDTDDVTSSQGVFRRDFVSLLSAPRKKDACNTMPSFFEVGGVNVRQAEPRNTPTVINAIYNFRNFWDGRANNIFNGRNPFGPRDPTAGVDPLNSVMVADAVGNLVPMPIIIPDASLASQADGPVLSDFEMSCRGRVFEEVGQKMLRRKPLDGQTVDPTDSVLGPYAGKPAGLTIDYATLIKQSFAPKFWNSSHVTVDGYTQMEKNFSLFWGLSIMLYESTLVSDDTPFDRYMQGNIQAMTTQQVDGFLQVFMGKGGCIFCHKGAEFTGAATSLKNARDLGAQVEHMIMGDGTVALYDSGFYNIGVRPPVEDIGVGGGDPFGNPLSWSRQAKNASIFTGPTNNLINIGRDEFNIFTCNFQVDPCVPINSNFRDAVDGSFKVPSLRNVELTGPYFHNGGQATLEQVVEFYNRGADGRGTEFGNTTGYGQNLTNRAPAILPLHLSATDKANLVAFLKALTDDRVRWEKAPFDHPELRVPNGHPINENQVTRDGPLRQAVDDLVDIPAVGAAGRAAKKLPPLMPFDAGLK